MISGGALLRARQWASPPGAPDEARLLHDADPSARQGLAPDAARGPRSVRPRRRARLHRGLCRRARDRPGREHHLLRDVHRVAHRQRRSASGSAPARSTCRTAIRPRSPAQIAMLDHMLDGRFNFGISPGGLLSDAEVFGNLDADRNAMFLEAINQVLAIWAGEPPYDLDGKYWKVSTERTLHPGDRPGHHAEAAAAPASADRRHRGRAVLEGRHRGGGARLGADLGELPDAELGQDPLAEIRRGLRARRPPGRSRELARRQKHLRRRRRRDRARLRDRAEQPLPLLLPPALHQAEEERPHRPVQDATRPCPTTRSRST